MIASTAALKSTRVPATFRCRQCGAEGQYLDNPRFAAFRPTVCDSCDARRANQDAVRERQRVALTAVPFPTWDPTKGNLQTLQKVMGATKAGGSLWIVGDTGAGKSRALCQAVIRAVHAGKSVEWRNCGAWLDVLAAASAESMVGYVKAKAAAVQGDVLVLDDLGKGKATERTASAMFDVVDRALVVNCALWVTSNHTFEAIEAKFGPEYGAPLVRRLWEVCQVVEVRSDV